MFTYRSDKFDTEVLAHSFSRPVAKIVERCEQASGPEPLFDRYTARFLSKRVENARIVAQERIIDGAKVLVLLDLVMRKNSEYDRLADDPTKFGRERFESIVDDNVLRPWVAERRLAPSEALPDLPVELQSWLVPPGWDTELDETPIYEGVDWVRDLRERGFSGLQGLLQQLLATNLDRDRRTGFHRWTSNGLDALGAIQILGRRRSLVRRMPGDLGASSFAGRP